jgi:hypothetical protein
MGPDWKASVKEEHMAQPERLYRNGSDMTKLEKSRKGFG